jgi:broad specificity phosphatase PhoE
VPVFFLRHGQSEANALRFFAGQRRDSPLTAIGIDQARQAGQNLTVLGIDRIIASKLERSYRTAVEVAQIIAFEPGRIETDDRILEYDMGSLTGKPIKKYKPRERTGAPGAEDPAAFRARVLSFFSQYGGTGETILVVSHAGVGRALEAARQRLDPRDFYSLPPYPNAQAVELDLAWLN